MKTLFHIILSFTIVALTACGEGAPVIGVEQQSNDSQVSDVPLTNKISKKRLNRIDAVLQEEVDAGIRAGFVAMVAKDGEAVYQTAVGMADRENGVPMAVDTRFRIMSMTKAVTTVAIMQLVEEGYVLLSDPVSNYLPAFANIQVVTSPTMKPDGSFETEPLERPMTIHHLLTHTAGFAAGWERKTDLDRYYSENSLHQAKGDLAARIDLLTTFPLAEQPGEKFLYSYGLDVAGRIVEIVSGKSLEAYFQDKIFKPLGMKDTEFFFDASDFNRLAVVYDVDEEGKLIPAAGPNDQALGWMPGGAGLVSTAGDYARFFMMLLNGGEFDGKRLLSPVSINLMLQRNIPRSAGYRAIDSIAEAGGSTFGLGGDVLETPGLRGEMGTVGEWGWFGYFNTRAFLSPSNELIVIVMSQQLPVGAPKSRAGKLVKAIAYGAVEN